MMKPQGKIKLLNGGMRIGLMLLAAGVGHGFAQTASTPNDMRKVLSQAVPADSSKPAPAKAAPAKPATSTPPPADSGKPAATKTAQTKPATPTVPATPTPPATAKTAQSKPAPAKAGAPQAQVQAKTPSPTPGTAPKSTGKPAVESAARPAPAAAPNPGAPEVIPVAEHPVSRRDPFDPLVNKEKEAGGPQAPLPAGKPGLMVATLRVDGIVRSPNGMIAVVSNPQMRVYFLREGDHLYDGEVEHITMEGVAFHQTGKDAFGKAVERESTKRLYPTPGEQQ
jgi:type IV pilus assembly PilP-like protein